MKSHSTIPDSNIFKLCDWSRATEIELKKIYLSIGKSIVGKNFVVQDEIKTIITNLLKYFTGNESEYNLEKGIYLYGNFGVGKTVTFKILQKLLSEISPYDETGKKQNANGFMITSLEQIIETYKSDGNMDYFGYRRESKPLHLCINEFGKPINEKIYGTQADNLIYSLFMVRYELFQTGILTHVTSNFKPEKLNIEQIVKDRMVEMFNFIEVKGDSLRK